MESTKPKKRRLDVLVLSDIHLGTYGCHAGELLRYLKSVKPKVIVLNGDVIDMWQFSKRYWPKSHMRVVKKLVSWIGKKGIKMYYLTGNHDEMLRRFAGLKMGSLIIDNKLVLVLDGKKVWFFHGDVFDVTMQHSKWLTRLGAHGYDLLILLNALVNWCSVKMGRGRISLSKKIKNGVKRAVSYVNNFETVCADTCVANGFDYVVCGHIHQPVIKQIDTERGQVVYMNSGDWVENLTALEYADGRWSLYRFHDDPAMTGYAVDETFDLHDDRFALLNNKQIFSLMLQEFQITTSTTKTKPAKP